MKKKLLWILALVLLIIILIIASIYINTKSQEYVNESVTENMINKAEDKEELNVLEVNDKNFEQEVLKSDIPVLVDFYANWCGPCKIFSPIVAEVAKEREDVKVVKVNVDEAQETSLKYQIMSIPTLIFIKEGKEANRSVGIINKSELLNFIK